MTVTRGNGNLAVGFEGGTVIAYGTFTAGATVQTATVRTGTYALKIAHAANYQELALSPGGGVGNTWSMRCYVYLSSVPTAGDVAIATLAKGAGFDHAHGIGIRSDGTFQTYCRANNAAGTGPIAWGGSGIAAQVNKWTRLEFRVEDDTTTAPDTEVTTGYVDGVALGTATQLQDTGGPLQNMLLGNATFLSFASPPTFDAYFDDIVSFDAALLGTSNPWPIGGGAVYLQVPASDSGSSTPASFIDDSGNSPPNPSWSRLDELPPSAADTDWVKQNGGGGSDYIEVALTPVATPTGTPQASTALIGYSQTDGIDFVDVADRFLLTQDPAASTPGKTWFGGVIANIGGLAPTTFGQAPNISFRSTGLDNNWTITELNDVRFRFGFNTRFNSLCLYHWMALETDIFQSDALGIGSWQMLG